ncbi:hypothetical protein GUA87_17135 [Sneathiella sp. P13V-1]|uniref:flagellar hook-length control protein FliK n=1 Tax=Sneathiella sp. P13V-1 TaxID=2697366 RepID=UPI00187BBA54|nr:flagellar hook-length control protein FliK [Sneathiella sp. P13V-1]MBE7638584.1 hypothetical protein [Sneathiella sp. P13V-1]
MDITQIAKAKDASFNWGPQVGSAHEEDFAKYIDTAAAETSDYEVSDSREARPENDRSDDQVDASSETEHSEAKADEDANNETPNIQLTEEALPAAVETTTTQLTGTTEVTSITTSKVPMEGSESVQPMAITQNLNGGEAKPVETLSKGNVETAINETLPVNAKAASPTEKAQQVIANTPASETAKSMVGKNTEVTQTVASTGSSEGKSVVTSAASQQAVAANPQQKTVSNSGAKQVLGSDEAPTVVAQQTAKPTAMQQMRQDEMAHLTDKETLSNKISELLGAAKGKVSLASNGKATSVASVQNSVISGETATQATLLQNNSTLTTPQTATAVGTVTQNVMQAEMPIVIPNGEFGTTLITPATSDLSTSGTLASTGGAVTGVDSTSASSASQSSLANRATSQAGSPAEQVSSQLISASKDGADKIKVQLHPAELGRVDIKLEIAQDGRILAAISAENQDSLDLLQQDSKLLEQALKDAGFDADGDSLSFSLQQGTDGEEMPTGEQVETANSEPEEEISLETQLAALSAQNATSGGLNIQV